MKRWVQKITQKSRVMVTYKTNYNTLHRNLGYGVTYVVSSGFVATVHTFEILDVCYRNVDPLKQMFFRDLNLSPHYAFHFLDGGGWTGRTQ